jgi:YggT family protein
MRQLLYVFCHFVDIMLTVLQLLMFARALTSWILADDDSPIVEFLYAVTEPLIIPVRALLERSEFIRDLPIDVSFFATYILLTVVQSLLPSVNI